MSRVGTQPQTGSTHPPTHQQTPPSQAFKEKVAKKAYEKWLKRGCKDGHDLQDWVEAEKEVLAEQGQTGSSYYR